MKTFKYSIWIFVLFLVQTVVMGHIMPFGLKADLVLAFVTVTAVREDSCRASTAVAVICAVMAAALSGRNFYFCLLFYTYLGLFTFAMRRRPRHLPPFWRYAAWIAPSAVVSEIICGAIGMPSASLAETVFIRLLPAAAYTVVCAVLIYPIASATLFKAERKLF